MLEHQLGSAVFIVLMNLEKCSLLSIALEISLSLRSLEKDFRVWAANPWIIVIRLASPKNLDL